MPRSTRRLRWLVYSFILVLFVFALLEVKSKGPATSMTFPPRSPANVQLTDTKRLSSKQIFQRNKTQSEVCGKTFDKHPGVLSDQHVRNHLVIDRAHHMVYCGIEKIGSTFWRRVFRVLESPEFKSPFDIKALHALGGGETFRKIPFYDIHNFLNSFTKFIFVRNPYSRLYSGYIDKLYSPNPSFWGGIGRAIVKRFRKSPQKHSLECGHDVTFPEFIEYVIMAETNGTNRDGHFLPMFDHCKPCQIRYDIIGKMETFEEDTFSIFDHLGLTDLKTNLHNFSQKSLKDTILDTCDNLLGVKNSVRKCLPFPFAFQRIWMKMKIRGIIDPDIKFPQTNPDTMTTEECVEIFFRAAQESTNLAKMKAAKKEYFTSAYRGIPIERLKTITSLFEPDFDIFGYDKKPKELFER